MSKDRPRLSAKRWAEIADSGFTPTVVKLPEGTSFFSPKKAGTFRLEIIPYEVPANPKGGQNPNAQPGELHYERTYFSHRGIGADERSYVCPAKTCGRPCPICEHRRELMRDRDADEDLIKALAPKQRQLWNIYDHAEPEKGVQVWDVSFHLFGRQLKAAINNADEDDGWEYFADPADGLTLRIGMEEKSFAGNSFLECTTVGFKSRREPLSDEILDAAQPLDDLLILLDYDKLKSIFLQEEGVDHGDDEPAPKKERKQSKPADDDDEPAQKKQSKPAKEEKPKAEEKPVTAADLGIGKGDDCRYAGKNWTIIRVSEDGLTVTLSNDDDEVRNGIKVADLQPPAGQDDVAPKKDEDEKPSKSKQDDSDDWDADFDDEPKKGKGEKPKADKVKTGPKKEDAKKPAKDDSDDWDDF